MHYKHTEEKKVSYFQSKAILKTIPRTESIGQIYRKLKIRMT